MDKVQKFSAMGLFLSKQSTKGIEQTAPKLKLTYFSETLTPIDETIFLKNQEEEKFHPVS
jgi:hypothetical protein